LQSVAAQSLALRKRQIAAAEEIIDGHVNDFCQNRLSPKKADAGELPVPQLRVPDLRISES
jgi:hypothetical protein